jgi:uncharacterized protein (DUF2237 family)
VLLRREPTLCLEVFPRKHCCRYNMARRVIRYGAAGCRLGGQRPRVGDGVAVVPVQCAGADVQHPDSDTLIDRGPRQPPGSLVGDAGAVTERNVLGGELEPCGTSPMTGFFRDGCCSTGPEDLGSHTICAVVTAEFLGHQRSIGNDLSTPRPQYQFPGLVPGDRWCVTAANWARAFNDGVAAPVVLASTHEAVLDMVPLTALRDYAVDVPADPGSLES